MRKVERFSVLGFWVLIFMAYFAAGGIVAWIVNILRS